MSKFMKGIKGGVKEVSAQDIDAIADKLHQQSSPTPLPVDERLEILASGKPAKKRAVEIEEDKEELHRLTIDIPKDMFDRMKKDTKRRGQTIKGFIVSMIYDYYDDIDSGRQ
jgi:hypothetical protein